ncbi:MAG TPA: hypothetical protein PK256_24735, partial [Verrucomicrobiota bacterium]|nr:hypothetical protein [Verrucomicrobiota bacterium]
MIRVDWRLFAVMSSYLRFTDKKLPCRWQAHLLDVLHRVTLSGRQGEIQLLLWSRGQHAIVRLFNKLDECFPSTVFWDIRGL